MRKLFASIYTNARVRHDLMDVVKVIVGFVAAKYGLKLA